MNYVHYCLKCKGVFKYPTSEVHKCPDCNVEMAYLVPESEWAALSMPERMKLKNEEGIKRLEAQRRIEEEKRRAEAEKEAKKVAYAKSLNDFYEYDVVTIYNDGAVNVDLLRSTLDAHAKNGWKLHSIYSNELGKNSHTEWNVNVNSTVSQDVLIFERKIVDESLR